MADTITGFEQLDTDGPVTDAEVPILGSARGTFDLPEGWDDPLTDREIEEIFGGD